MNGFTQIRTNFRQMADHAVEEVTERAKGPQRLSTIDAAELIARELEAHAARIRNATRKK